MSTPPKQPQRSRSPEPFLTTTLREYTGRTLDNRYQLLRVLGRGGMGSVFLAKHVVIGKLLAVKLLDSQRLGAKGESSRLFREAQMAAAIGHPNIIEVLDVGVTPEGHPFLVMEYLHGEDVASILRRRGPLTLATACAVVEPVLLALQAAHARHIVHRDLKPANIFVVQRKDSPPTVKLIDFGIAKDLGPTERAQLTLPGALLGTPSYMPPEQATGIEDVDTRADIYGVGISLYEMLTDKLPFNGSNYNETLYRIVTDDAPRPESPLEELPQALVDCLEKAMHKDPDQRYQSPAEFLEALKGLDSWPERGRQFEQLAADLRPRDIHTGLEATQLSPESPLSPAARARRGEGKVDSDMVETVAEGASLQPRQSVSITGAPWLLKLAIPAAIASLALFMVWLLDTPTHAPSAPTSAAPVGAARVSITIAGAPEGATILYDGNRVSGNPFHVDATSTLMPLRVEMSGFEPFVATVSPTRDTVVRVGLQEKRASTPKPTPTPQPPSASAEPKPRPKQGPKPPPPTVRKGGRGSFYTEKFE